MQTLIGIILFTVGLVAIVFPIELQEGLFEASTKDEIEPVIRAGGFLLAIFGLVLILF